MFTGKAVLPIIFLLVGIIVATFQIRGQSKAVSQASIVRMPMIGGAESKREGPWPECVGLTGEACRTLIEATASDIRGNVKIIPEDYMVTMDFRTDRVRIFVDGDGLVVQIPHRG